MWIIQYAKLYNFVIRELQLSSVRSNCGHTGEEGEEAGQGSAGEEGVVEAEEDAELPVVEIREVVGGVGDVQPDQDHQGQGHDHVDQVQQEVQQETPEGGRYLVGCDETNTSPHYVEAPSPVSLTIRYFITVQSYRNYCVL